MQYIHKTGMLAALLGCTLAAPALAADKATQSRGGLFSYDYIQAAYVDLDAGFEGIKLEGSFELNKELALIGSYMSTGNGQNYDYDVFTMGLAYHMRLTDIPRSDLVLHGEFARASVEHPHSFFYVHDHDDNGLRLGATLRHQAKNNIEFFGDLSYVGLYNNDLALTGGVNLALNQQFSVVAAIELSDDDMLLLGARMKLK